MGLLMLNETTAFKLAVWKIEEQASFFEDAIAYAPQSVHPGRRLQQLATRFLLKQLNHDFPIDTIVINESGKPFLPGQELQFNLTHTTDLAAAIISDLKAVGIDAEKIDQRVLKIEHKFLNSEERKSLTSLTEIEKISRLTLYWTIKEAVYKWWGRGAIDFANDILIEPSNLTLENTTVRFAQTGEILNVSSVQLDQHWITYLVK
ncbi:MAG: 4'-phosphopantetheinyl transferase family protein [Chitinophagaceae bacterium]|jgi:phosphopantetheinyl transferase